MKKFFVFAALAAFALTSCEQKIDVPAVIPTPGSSESTGLVFTATTESSATKTALSENGGNYDVVWQSGDQITIVDGAATPNVGKYTTTSTTTEATFTFVPESGTEAAASPFKAWYPASIYNDATPTLPATQNYVEGNISGAPMFASSSTTSLKFKNLGGIICLNLSTSLSDISVASISLSATQPMSGPITNVGSLSSDTPVAATVSGTAGVTLNCGAGVAISSTSKPFYIAVPANEYTGLNITVRTTGGKTQTRSLKADRSILVARSGITEIALSFNDFQIQVIDLSSLEDKNLTVPAGTSAILTGARNDCIVTLEDGANITLRDATLNQIVVQEDATVILEGVNRFQLIDSRDSYNFIQLGSGGHLSIQGTGSLTGSGGGWPGIGCIIGDSDVTIEGGTLNLSANDVQAGSSKPSISVRNLTVEGGSLTAWGGNNYYYGDTRNNAVEASQNIVIRGGAVNANGSHGLQATGNITISGGYVTATGAGANSTFNSGISAGGLLTISGGEVTAQGAAGSPGIGDKGTCGDILISGGTVSAYGGTGAAAIGTGSASTSVCGNITIHNTVEWVAAFKGDGATEAVGHGHAESTVGTIIIEDGANVSNDYPRTDLSAGGTANSYIVPAKGHYKFLATKKGNGSVAKASIDPLTDAANIVSAKLLWATFGTNVAPWEGELINDIRYQDGYVLFSSGNPYREGNAVVAIYNSNNEIIWSWHLWFTDDAIQTQTYPGGAQMMDRNLGALAAVYNAENTEDYGLMYQWGRKDPFLNTCFTGYYNGFVSSDNWRTANLPAIIGTSENILGATQSNAYTAPVSYFITNPTTLIFRGSGSARLDDYGFNIWANNMTNDLWDEQKTIFDPCPPGWKVPGKAVWDDEFVESFRTVAAAGLQNNGFSVGKIRYPSTGVRIPKEYTITRSTPTYAQIKAANGYCSLERNSYYHVFVWAYDGFFVKEYFNGEETMGMVENTPGAYRFDQFGGEDNTYSNLFQLYKAHKTRAASVRCVKE